MDLIIYFRVCDGGLREKKVYRVRISSGRHSFVHKESDGMIFFRKPRDRNDNYLYTALREQNSAHESPAPNRWQPEQVSTDGHSLHDPRSWDYILDNTKYSKTVRQSVSHNTTVPVQEISISINETETLTPILFKPIQCLSHVWPQMLNWAIKFVHWSLCALSHRSIVWSYFNLFNFGFSFWDRREKRFYSFECSSWDPKYLGYGGPSAWGISIWYRSPALESHTVVNILLSRHSVSIFDTCIYGSITLWIGSRDLRSKIASGLFRVSTSVFISILTFSGTVL